MQFRLERQQGLRCRLVLQRTSLLWPKYGSPLPDELRFGCSSKWRAKRQTATRYQPLFSIRTDTVGPKVQSQLLRVGLYPYVV